MFNRMPCSESNIKSFIDSAFTSFIMFEAQYKLRNQGFKRIVPDTLPRDHAFSFLSKTQLTKLKLKAMRAGVWFKALPRIDRVLVDLTIRVAGNVRSMTLAKNILAVIRKLEGLLESKLMRAMREVGLPLAQKLSSIAQKWGNTSAESWITDSSFAYFLAVMHTNDPKTFKT